MAVNRDDDTKDGFEICLHLASGDRVVGRHAFTDEGRSEAKAALLEILSWMSRSGERPPLLVGAGILVPPGEIACVTVQPPDLLPKIVPVVPVSPTLDWEIRAP